MSRGRARGSIALKS